MRGCDKVRGPLLRQGDVQWQVGGSLQLRPATAPPAARCGDCCVQARDRRLCRARTHRDVHARHAIREPLQPQHCVGVGVAAPAPLAAADAQLAARGALGAADPVLYPPAVPAEGRGEGGVMKGCRDVGSGVW
jgi:hypothetical protein